MRISTQKNGGKIAENRALTGVNRRYFGGFVTDFLRLIDVNAGGFRLKEGQGILHPRNGGEKTNKHKQLRGIVPEMGGGQIVYVLPFLMGKREQINKIPRKRPGEFRDSPGIIPGQSRENFAYVFSC